MKKTISFLFEGKALLCGLLLTGGLLLFGTNEAAAQEVAGSGLNPYSQIGERLSVNPYELGAFERIHAINVLTGIVENLKPQLSNGGGSQYTRLKYDYCNAMLSDIEYKHIAVEITMLTSLSGLSEKESYVAPDGGQLVALYNEIATQLD